MRRIHASAGRPSALTGRLASPFFHQIAPSESSMQPVKAQTPQNPSTSASPTSRESPGAAIRKYRTLW